MQVYIVYNSHLEVPWQQMSRCPQVSPANHVSFCFHAPSCRVLGKGWGAKRMVGRWTWMEMVKHHDLCKPWTHGTKWVSVQFSPFSLTKCVTNPWDFIRLSWCWHHFWLEGLNEMNEHEQSDNRSSMDVICVVVSNGFAQESGI